MRRRSLAIGFVSAGMVWAAHAVADTHVDGAKTVELLGRFAAPHFAPTSGMIGALVKVPKSTSAEALGLRPVADGFAGFRGTPEALRTFALAHPGVSLEVSPPLHLLMDRAGVWANVRVPQKAGFTGEGVLVGIADTGLDVSHPDVRDDNGRSRVAWMLDFSRAPLGLHPDLEAKFGVPDATGKIMYGAVLSGDDIDQILAGKLDACPEGHVAVENELKGCPPTDLVGHGTHVTTIATASDNPGSIYAGMAPKAKILSVRITRGDSQAIENDDLVRAVDFMFERGDAMKMPTVVNMSLGSDFGPHDGTTIWEQAITSHVGAAHPGHVLVAAAGNSGSVSSRALHQSIHFTKGSRTRVPIATEGGVQGSVQVWITLRGDGSPAIGLEGPDGEWIPPIRNESQAGKNTATYNAGVVYGHVSNDIPIPNESRGAVVVWSGTWPAGTYNITFEGDSGSAELYLQADGLLSAHSSFAAGVREGTINLPATHPEVIGVGCTINRISWKSVGNADVSLEIPVLDRAGGYATQTGRILNEGEMCWFSSAGPNALGTQKPEIAAPGGFVVAGMSRDAPPSSPLSIFSASECPRTKSGAEDDRCLQIDGAHGVSVGTSMSSPLVAGAVAILLQRDPTLTQDVVRALLQGGAHKFRGDAPFQDQSGPGEVDVAASLDALSQLSDSTAYLPSHETSWITLSADYVPADGSRDITAIIELRTADGQKRADYFDSTRLTADVRVDGVALLAPQIVRRGPGVFTYQASIPAGHGGSIATFGALFDGSYIVPPRSIAIATDPWNARYPARAVGGCAASDARRSGPFGGVVATVIALAMLIRRRRSRANCAAP